ncbi:MAG: lipopolysaccharide transport periplasmic protein LptA [Pseudoxanthomonas sp.]
MPPSPRASALLSSTLLLSLLLAAAAVGAKTSDRAQDMAIDAGHQESDYSDNGKTVWSQGVTVTQGSLSIQADSGTLQMRNGDPSLATFVGKPVKLRQQMDDGTWMDAKADRIEYDLNSETITLIGNYTVSSPKGSNSGQRMVYNTKSGAMQAGGDGTRVQTVIKPKSAQGKATVGKPAPADKPAATPSDTP